nr:MULTISPECIES: lipoprotein [Cupriavidus]
MSLLSGCGVRGPLVMPKRPPEPTAPAAPDPGLGRPDAVYAPGAPAAAAPAASAPASK